MLEVGAVVVAGPNKLSDGLVVLVFRLLKRDVILKKMRQLQVEGGAIAGVARNGDALC